MADVNWVGLGAFEGVECLGSSLLGDGDDVADAHIEDAVHFFCGDISFLWLVVASALVNFVLGRGINKFRDKAPAKAFLALGLVLNLGTLVGFKYTGFFIENLNNWFSLSIPVPDLPLPLGISFFTFPVPISCFVCAMECVSFCVIE